MGFSGLYRSGKLWLVFERLDSFISLSLPSQSNIAIPDGSRPSADFQYTVLGSFAESKVATDEMYGKEICPVRCLLSDHSLVSLRMLNSLTTEHAFPYFNTRAHLSRWSMLYHRDHG